MHSLLLKRSSHEVNFSPHPDASKFEKGDKVVYYQENPLPNWGPGSRAKNIKSSSVGTKAGTEGGKRQSEKEEQGTKRVRVDDDSVLAEDAVVNG